MIDTAELRIGNIINQTNLMFNDGYFPIVVESIGHGINVTTGYECSLDWESAEDFEGLLLSDEILLSNGFKCENGWFEQPGAIFFLNPQFEFWIGNLKFEDHLNTPLKIIKFVHELQNLVFVLFNHEIEINIPAGIIDQNKKYGRFKDLLSSHTFGFDYLNSKLK